MLSRCSIAVTVILLTLVCHPSMKSAEGEDSKLRSVRVIYLVSGDRQEIAAYTAALEHAIKDLQGWYAKQLGGPTFRLSDPIVEVVKSERPADWFYANPNGENKDDWGFNNTLDEAKRLRGAKHNDPQFVWVIYSDGPGNKGRGGSGVACLPEDDLLGLVGKHPTQKDKLRWIAGLGHELGHGFGLPHPTDTKKHADALMWTGIYGKYPDQTYLTDEDKKILMRSPFFYHPNNTPVFQKGKVVARYAYPGGAFEQHAGKAPIYWSETKADGEAVFTFEESKRDAEHIFLHDAGRGITIRLPIAGGQSMLSTDGEKNWRPLYQVAAPTAPSVFNGAKAGEERQIAGVKLCWCPPGKFTMGSPKDEPERRPGEDQVEVRFSKGFWMAKFEATQGDWKRVVGKLPGELTAELPEGDDYPVGNVNFAEAEAFCQKLTELARKSGDLPQDWAFRLPTEAQWEYACRAGTTTATSFGDKLSSKQANFKGQPYNGGEPGPSLGRAARVGSYPTNAWGLHDMHGNTYEWCRDWYHKKLPGGTDPDLHAAKATATKSEHGDISRSRRGGCWADEGWPCRTAFRLRFEPDRRYDHIGFRVVAVRR